MQPNQLEPQPTVTEPIAQEPAVEDVPRVPVEPEQPFAWQASEYVHHQKGVAWYMGLVAIIAALLAVAVIYQLWLSVAVFIIMGVAIAVYAQRPPRLLEYQLDSKGITIDGKFSPYENFRSFGLVRDESWHSIDLEPTKRFMPRLSLVYSQEDSDELVSHLSRHLPRADRSPDVIELASRYLRF